MSSIELSRWEALYLLESEEAKAAQQGRPTTRFDPVDLMGGL
jgi:hypothetical protein